MIGWVCPPPSLLPGSSGLCSKTLVMVWGWTRCWGKATASSGQAAAAAGCWLAVGSGSVEGPTTVRSSLLFFLRCFGEIILSSSRQRRVLYLTGCYTCFERFRPLRRIWCSMRGRGMCGLRAGRRGEAGRGGAMRRPRRWRGASTLACESIPTLVQYMRAYGRFAGNETTAAARK